MQSPWALRYELQLRDGITFLKVYLTNRFTNDSEAEIDEDGRSGSVKEYV